MQPKAFFLPAEIAGDGQRFCLFYPARPNASNHPPRGLVVYIHPFAEEMNKARRMAALQARKFAHSGYSVLQIDLLGCGDSSGDFGDATWQDWVNDVLLGCNWLRQQNMAPHADSTHLPLWLWGLRAGCLLAVEAARQLDAPCNFLFWQPSVAGKTQLHQFLRLKVAGDMLNGQGQGTMESLRQQLLSGFSLEIAGYTLAAGLAVGLQQADLEPTLVQSGTNQRIEWMEVSDRDDAHLSPAAATALARWQQAGFAAHSSIVRGPPFWQTTEIEDAPDLLAATVAALLGMPS